MINKNFFYSVPTSETSQVVWEPFTTTDTHFLRILDPNEVNPKGGLELSLQNPHEETITFWDPIYDSHFLDTKGKWELTERIEDEEDEIIEETEDNSDEENENGAGGEVIVVDSSESIVEEEDAVEEEENVIEGEENEKDPNSASIAVGHTFMIVALFTLVNKFHGTQIVS